MRKRILIIVPYLGIGGTTSSLCAFLENINPEKLGVDVFARKRTGDYLSRLPHCTILPENIFLSKKIYFGSFFIKCLNLAIVSLAFLTDKLHLSIQPLICKLGGKQMHTDSYDAVIGYQESLCSFVSFLPAKKRVSWIRSEYERYLSIIRRDETEYYRKIDTVVAVSEYAKASFLKVHPWHPHVVTIYNCMNIDEVRRLATDDSNVSPLFVKGDFTIVSVGRISPVKQFEKIPAILSSVRNQTGKDVKWYLIGSDRTEGGIVKKIIEDVNGLGISDSFFILPETSNPYVYMAKADLFVHTSRSETYSRVVAEAKSVGTPIVVNNYGAAYEFVENNVDGAIVPIDQMAVEISSMINDSEKYSRLRSNLREFEWFNNLIMDKTLAMI